MICNKCGKECADDAKFCTNCGTELIAEEVSGTAPEEAVVTVTEEETVTEDAAEATAEEETEVNETDVKEAEEAEVREVPAEAEKKKAAAEDSKKPGKGKILKVVGAVAAILVLILLIKAICSGGEEYIALDKDAVLAVKEADDKVIAIMSDGNVVELDVEECSYVEYSQDRSVACFFNEDDALCVLRKGKLVKTGIEDAGEVIVSAYGDTIAYMTDIDFRNSCGTLNLYYTKSGKKKEIAEEVLCDSAVLSPNGETVAYVGDYEAIDDFKGYYSVNGKKPVALGKEKYIFAIADKAAYIYYLDDDRIYAQKKKKDEEKLASGIYYSTVFLNADHTEMLFVNDDKTYITVKAGEKEKVSNEEFGSILLPSESIQNYVYRRSGRGAIEVNYTGADTFKEQLFYAGGKIIYMNKKQITNTVASGVMDFAVAEDGESFVYAGYSGDIMSVTDFDKGGREKKIGNDAEAVGLYAGGSLKYVYYINSDDELCCIKGKKTKKIADDVTSAAISADGKVCYFVVEEEKLCYSAKAGKEKKIASGDEGISCGRYYNMVIAAMEDEDEEVISVLDGNKLKELYKQER